MEQLPQNSAPTPPVGADKKNLLAKSLAVKNFIGGLSYKQKLIIFIVSFAVLSVVTALCVVLPAGRDIIYLNKEVSDYKEDLERKYSERFNVRKTLNDLENAKKILPTVEPLFIPKNGEIDFVESLESVADKYSLQQKLRLESGKTNGFITPINLTLTLDGDFQNILNYLQDLEKNELYIDFKEFLISKQKSGITADIKGTVWMLN